MDILHPVTGLAQFDGLALANRVMLGTFFAISGYHKLFNAGRRATLATTFKADGCYSPAMMWAVPLGEFFGGLAILMGFLTPLAALGLVLICGGAVFFDGVKRVRAWRPIDRADAVDDALYLPEVLYVAMLLFLILGGPGRYSADAYLWTLFR